jgi:hypothetical protein
MAWVKQTVGAIITCAQDSKHYRTLIDLIQHRLTHKQKTLAQGKVKAKRKDNLSLKRNHETDY